MYRVGHQGRTAGVESTRQYVPLPQVARSGQGEAVPATRPTGTGHAACHATAETIALLIVFAGIEKIEIAVVAAPIGEEAGIGQPVDDVDPFGVVPARIDALGVASRA